MAELKPCPWCNSTPEVEPANPVQDGNAWAEVRCVNADCPANPCVADGEIVADERGSEAYKQAAIARWNRRAVPPVGERERRIAETIQDYLDCYDEADRCFGCDNDAGREHAEDCTEAPRIKEARAWADSILSSPAPDPASEPRAKGDD